MEINNYFERKAVSRSLLSELTRHPQRAKAMLDGTAVRVESDAMNFGSMFDSLMFDTSKEFTSKYRVSQYENPWTDRRKNTGKFTYALEQIMQETLENDATAELETMFMQAYTQSGIKSPKVYDLIAEFVEIGGRDWASEYMMSKTITLITQEQYNKAAAMKATLINNKYVGDMFVQDVPESHRIMHDNIEIVYQMDMTFELQGVQCKALPDIVIIDHKMKIIQVVDLKTTSSYDHNVMSSFIKFGYDLQGAWYTIAMQALTKQAGPLNGYEVSSSFLFVFIDTVQGNEPVCVRMSETDLDSAINGGFRYNKKQKGAMEIFNDYIWHVNNDKWDYSKECYDNEGMLVTNIYDNVLERV
jgi:hypothetical protein